MHGLFCPICLNHLIRRKAVHFEKKLESFLSQTQNAVAVKARKRQEEMLTVRSAASLSFTTTSPNQNVYKLLIDLTEAGALQPTTSTSTQSGATAVIFHNCNLINLPN